MICVYLYLCSNHWDYPSEIVSVEDTSMVGRGYVLKQHWHGLKDFVGLAGIQRLLELAEKLTGTVGSHVPSRRANREDIISRHYVALLALGDLTHEGVAQMAKADVFMATVACHDPRAAAALNR
jgi:hypothetical protein